MITSIRAPLISPRRGPAWCWPIRASASTRSGKSGCPQWDDARLAFVVPATGRAKAGIYCVGAVTGEFRLEQALAETHQTIAALLATFDKKDSLAGIDLHTGEPETLASRRIFRVS